MQTDVLTDELRAAGPSRHASAWMLTLCSSAFSGSGPGCFGRGHSSQTNGDSRRHALWGLGGSPHPSRMLLAPWLQDTSGLSGGWGQLLRPGLPSCGRQGCRSCKWVSLAERRLRCLQQEKPTVGKVLSWGKVTQLLTIHFPVDGVGFSGSRSTIPAIYGEYSRRTVGTRKGFPLRGDANTGF